MLIIQAIELIYGFVFHITPSSTKTYVNFIISLLFWMKLNYLIFAVVFFLVLFALYKYICKISGKELEEPTQALPKHLSGNFFHLQTQIFDFFGKNWSINCARRLEKIIPWIHQGHLDRQCMKQVEIS